MWLDRAIRLLEKHHIAVVLGTPTAGPPAWLTHKYPETLRVEPDGQRVAPGNRAHGSPTSVKYREFCRGIAEEMAKRSAAIRMLWAGRLTTNTATL